MRKISIIIFLISVVFSLFSFVKIVSAIDLLEVIKSGERPSQCGCSHPPCPPCCLGDREFAWKGECHSIDDLCSTDPMIRFNTNSEECFCPSNYILEEKNGTMVCIQKEQDINLIITRIKDIPVEPFLADGKTTVMYIIKGFYKVDNSPVELDIQDRIFIDEPASKSDIFRKEGDDYVQYEVTYITPNLLSEENPTLFDEFVIEYPQHQYRDLKKQAWSSKNTFVKRHKILLTADIEESLTAFKAGFKPVSKPIKSNQAKKLKILTYTLLNGMKLPVAGVDLDFPGANKAKTDSKGNAELIIEKNFLEEEKSIEVELVLEDKVSQNLSDARISYNSISVKEQDVKNFLDNFLQNLAKEEDYEKVLKLLAGLETVDYALLFVAQGEQYSSKLTEKVGDVVSQVVKGVLDFALGLVDFGGKIQESVEKIGSKKLWKKLKIEQMKKIDDFLQTMPETYIRGAWAKFTSAYLQKNPDTFPGVFVLIYDEIFGKLVDKSWEKSWEFKEAINAISIKNTVKKCFDESYSLFTQEMMETIAQTIIDDSFIESEAFRELQINISLESYKNFVESMLNKNEITYENAMINAWGDQIVEMGTLGTQLVLTVTAPGTYKAVDFACNALTNTYQAMKTLVDVGIMKMWSGAYNYNIHTVRNAVYNVMGVGYTSPAKDMSLNYFRNIANATDDEKDILKVLYDNNILEDDADRGLAVAYHEATIDLDFYGELNDVINILAEAAPDDPDIQETRQMLNAEYGKASGFVEENKEKVMKLDILKDDYVSKKKSDFNLDFDFKKVIPYVIGIVILALIVLLLRFKFIRKILIVLIIFGIIIASAVMFLLNDVGDVEKENDGGDNLPQTAASSFLPAEGSYTYIPENAFDKNTATAWVEGKPGAGEDEWIKFNFDKEQKVYGVNIMPGYGSSQDSYYKNNRVKQLRVEFSNSPSEFFELTDEYKTHDLYFDPVETDYVRIVIVSVYPGSKYNDTAISEIKFY